LKNSKIDEEINSNSQGQPLIEKKNKIPQLSNVSVFVDFDGTITHEDIGDRLFLDFGVFEPHHTRLKNGEISIREYWNTVTATLKPGLTAEDIAAYAAGFQVDAYFKSFAEFCRDNDIKIRIISDGFDAYISAVMMNAGLDWIPVNCNHLDFNEGLIRPVFPLATESCSCMCASCKRNAILKNALPDDIIVFIGDGYSDYCAAEHSDIVFAKKHLAAYCNEHKIPHYPFSSFFDVLRLFKILQSKKKLKHRYQAQLLQKKAFETE
jgi:2-hydroxy-3-keto-5-methylthiopentenyl-1-phosphate phosphatase